MQFSLEISIDRPGNGLDTILSESGELTPANLQEVGQQLQTIFDGFDNESNEVKFDASATVTDNDGNVSNVTVSNVKKGIVVAIITTIGAINQTPPIYVPPVSSDSLTTPTTEVTEEQQPPVDETTSEQTPPIIPNPGAQGEVA